MSVYMWVYKYIHESDEYVYVYICIKKESEKESQREPQWDRVALFLGIRRDFCLSFCLHATYEYLYVRVYMYNHLFWYLHTKIALSSCVSVIAKVICQSVLFLISADVFISVSLLRSVSSFIFFFNYISFSFWRMVLLSLNHPTPPLGLR